VHFTFRASANWASYTQFMTGIAFGFPLTVGLLMVLISWRRLPMWIAAPATTILMFLYNYINARAAILWRRLRQGHRSVKPDGQAL
jgi:hypothetical protein